MKWREKREREVWYLGPIEGRIITYARQGGVTYEVQARYRDPIARRGDVLWGAMGDRWLGQWLTKKAAIAKCERAAADAAATKEYAKLSTPTTAEAEPDDNPAD